MNGLEAQEDLRAVGNMSAAFSGGKEAKRYVEGLHERAFSVRRFLEHVDPAKREAAARRREASKRAEVAVFARCVMGVEARMRGETPPPAPEASAPLAEEAPSCPPE